MTDKQQAKANALAKHLGIDVTDIEVTEYDNATFEVNGEEWLVLDDGEADQQCDEQIKDTLWAFRPEFLQNYTLAGIEAREIRAIIGDRCEDANEAITALVKDAFPELVEDAVALDGRGHFLSPYDGEEVALENDFFAYRTN